jgi:photosystem II stability/assembly factor-like uncharacterized protein
MTPDERELRRALQARSGAPTPAFRAGLRAVLAEGRPSGNLRPALAVVASVILVMGTVAVLLVSRHGGAAAPSHNPANPPAASTLSPTSTPIALPTTAQFSAPSSYVVWALVANTVLFRSTDRGGTWQRRPLPPSADVQGVSELSFLDDRQGWLLQSGSAATQCEVQTTTIWHTSDAGSTWQRVDARGIADSQCKDHLSFVDPTHGFLDAGDPNHAPLIYRTADAGRTWIASRALPDPPGFTTGTAGHVLEPGRVDALGSTLLVTAQGPDSESYVFRSTDAGVTWTYAATLPDAGGSVAFVTATRWVQLGTSSNETLDAGRTWHPYPSDYSQAAPIGPDVVFGDPQVGYATVRGSLQRTLDGGLHWSLLGTPGTG